MNRIISACLLAISSAPAIAGDIYGAIGVPGVVLGYSAPMTDRLALRGDFATIGRRNWSKSDPGINYDGSFKANRIGLFVDWFVSGGFRVTGGATFNDTRYDLTGRGNGGTINIGGQNYVAGLNDGIEVSVKFPRAMPYVGIGYGLAPTRASGWGLMLDLGLSIGRPSVSGRVTGPLASNVSQADVNRELANVRDDVGQLRGIPQLTIGAQYRF